MDPKHEKIRKLKVNNFFAPGLGLITGLIIYKWI